jgi:hypothetical protein
LNMETPLLNPAFLLQWNWKPRALRVLVAALADAGPASMTDWAVRTGVDARHVGAVIRELEALGGLKLESGAEGVRLLVQPPSFWRERMLSDAARWQRAWAQARGQRKLELVTEEAGLADALACNVPPNRGEISPESGRSADMAGGLGGLRRTFFIPKNVLRSTFLAEKDRTYKRDPLIGDRLREEVRTWVGARDFARYWARRPWTEMFDDERAVVIAGALHYLQAGHREGAVKIKHSNGAALWDEVKRVERIKRVERRDFPIREQGISLGGT